MYRTTLAAMVIMVITMVMAEDTTSLLSISNPAVNQMLVPNQEVIIQYSVQSVKQGARPRQITNYPNSLQMEFRWTAKSTNTNQQIELDALTGLMTDPSPGGLKNVTYHHRWKLPNCHFFRRYMPTEWSFSLVFQPNYPEFTTSPNLTSKYASLMVPLGPKQATITIPINVAFNATLMEDAKHKGC